MTKKTVAEMYAELLAPFPPERVKWRVGRSFWPKAAPAPTKGDTCDGLVLAYIDARDRDERLDQVFGPDGWNETIRVENGGFIAQLKVAWPYFDSAGDYESNLWVVREDGAPATDIEAFKGGISDAKKRAAVSLGIARYLYDLGDTKAKLYYTGHHWEIIDSELLRLAKLLSGEVKEEKKETIVIQESPEEALNKHLMVKRDEVVAKLNKQFNKHNVAKFIVAAQEAVKGKWDDLDALGKLRYILQLEVMVNQG